jgi:hypothetical protein
MVLREQNELQHSVGYIHNICWTPVTCRMSHQNLRLAYNNRAALQIAPFDTESGLTSVYP